MNPLKLIDKDFLFLGASSSLVFVTLYLVNKLLPANIAVNISYILSTGYLLGGLLGIFVLNGLKFESPDHVKAMRLKPLTVFLLCLAFLIVPIFAIAILAYVRVGLSRCVPRERNFYYIFGIGVVLIIGNVLCYFAALYSNLLPYDIYYFPLASISISVLIIILSGRSEFYLLTFDLCYLKRNSFFSLFSRLGLRLSYDFVLFLISFITINIAKVTLDKSDASVFFLIYSVMGISGIVVNVIESKMFAGAHGNNSFSDMGRGFFFTCVLIFSIPFLWLSLILGADLSISFLTGSCSVAGVLIGAEGVILRKKTDSRRIASVALILVLSFLCIFGAYSMLGVYSLYSLLLSYCFSLFLCFAIIRFMVRRFI